jgi:deoxyribonuclease-4
MSIAGGFHKAVDAAAALGMETVQVFTHSPSQWAVRPVIPAGNESLRDGNSLTKHNNQWTGKPLLDDDIAAFEASLKTTGIQWPIAHDSYLINLASPDDSLWKKSIDAFVSELQRADALGLHGVVMHPGSFVTSSEEEGVARIITALDEVHSRTPGCRPRTLLETTAGQGSNLGWRFEHLATILNGCRDADRMAVCVDTCHIFAAGYPLQTKKEYAGTFAEFDRLIGVERIAAFHLNDSLKGLGCRVDRHAHIGEGSLGIEPFRHLVNDSRFRHLPMYMETPKGDRDGEELDAINLRTLRSLIKRPASKTQPPTKTGSGKRAAR